MQKLQFSILDLLIGTAVFAFGCAALRGHSPIWESAMVTGTFVLLSLASFGACYSEGQTRSFRTAFAIVGWVFFILPRVPSTKGILSGLLTTTTLFYSLTEHLCPEAFTRDASGVINGVSGKIVHSYYAISECFTALIVGLLGGVLAICLRARRESRIRKQGIDGD
ncbi:hypothetical protein Pla144_51060 [Bythopirellula polymerisocia]|uniref:Uncharacterized protein n=1 Tax=Bythopirellula polymerisocia TaxID=2528003 RepID=A0A5C6C2X5_9BACT|nr:hypothetical protein Pla144_51060 [Bythopirellula polymerisocia]